MKKSLVVALVLSLTVITPGYAKELGPVGRRIRAILAENPFSATVQYQREEQRFEEAQALKGNIAPMPEMLQEDEAVAVYETGNEYYIAKKSNVQPDLKAEIREEPKASVSPAVSDYVVTDKDAFIYNEASFKDFDYTPEQLKQITDAWAAAADSMNNLVKKSSVVQKSVSDFQDSKYENPVIYEKVSLSSMRTEKFNAYRSADALQIVREAEPELNAKAVFTSATTAEEAYQAQKKRKNEYRPEKLDERHDGRAWDKIYRKEVEKDEFVPKGENMSKGLRSAIDESKKLREELRNLLGDKTLDDFNVKVPSGNGDNFKVKEFKGIDNGTKLSYPENTLYLSYSPNKVYQIKVSANKQTDIRLREYEKVTDITVGNQDNLYINGYRGNNGVHPHITIKPFDEGIKTKMFVTTNFSRYQFDLISDTEANYNPYVLFELSNNPSAPFDSKLGSRRSNATLKRTRRENKPIEVNDPDTLNWNYFIKGNKEFKPQYAWDDGQFTYVLLPKKAYNHEIYILGMIEDKAQQIREFEIQDDFMKLYGTWSKLRFRIDKEMIEIDNNGFIPE